MKNSWIFLVSLLCLTCVQGQLRRFYPFSNPFLQKDNCECGKANKVHDKIVGGKLTMRNEYPWMVSLHRTSMLMLVGLKSSHFCGGSLISSNWVLTAAHCTKPYAAMPLLITVTLGDFNLSDSSEVESVRRSVISVILHPNYNSVTFDSDISLIRLNTPIEDSSSRYIRPICLPAPSSTQNREEAEGQMATALGWGATKEGGRGSNSLYEVTVPVLSNQQCSEKYNSTGVNITSNMLCAGYPEGGRDTCQGDSGGPLQNMCVEQNNEYNTIIGVVSFGIGCARPGFPGVYARVSQFVSWIQEQTKIGNCQRSCSLAKSN